MAIESSHRDPDPLVRDRSLFSEIIRDSSNMLDATDEAIVRALTGNARMSQKELAHHVGLSSPSVSERLRRLEERDVIRGYTLDVNPRALGYQFQEIGRASCR